MKPEQYLSLNGIIKREDEAILKASNRAFRYGDALFETIRCIHQKPAYFSDHYQRLINGMSLLLMEIKSLPAAGVIAEQISALIQKNRIFGDARARLTIFREDGGLYTPDSNKINYLIEVTPLATNGYELNHKGLLIDVYKDDLKPINRFSLYKTANALFYTMAGLYKKAVAKDDVLLLNSNQQIIEGLASNLFWIKDDVFYTPFRSSGCVDGIMRKQLLRLIKKQGWQLYEVGGTDYDTLLKADEIFLSNAIQGIQWVVGLKEKRYFCKRTKLLNRLLNEDVTSYMTDSPGNSSML